VVGADREAATVAQQYDAQYEQQRHRHAERLGGRAEPPSRQDDSRGGWGGPADGAQTDEGYHRPREDHGGPAQGQSIAGMVRRDANATTPEHQHARPAVARRDANASPAGPTTHTTVAQQWGQSAERARQPADDQTELRALSEKMRATELYEIPPESISTRGVVSGRLRGRHSAQEHERSFAGRGGVGPPAGSWSAAQPRLVALRPEAVLR